MTGGAQDSGVVKWEFDPLDGSIYFRPDPLTKYVVAELQSSDDSYGHMIVDAVNATRATPAPAGWQPRIGEEVRVSEETAERWPDWRDTRLWVVGVSMDRNVAGTPIEGLNVCVSDEWPVTNRTGGFTDGFYINRPYAGDDLRPIPTAPAEGGV